MNICTLMPMRSIPFKVVCLLGMNDGVYPRTLAPLGFDLMSQNRSAATVAVAMMTVICSRSADVGRTEAIHQLHRALNPDNSERYPSVLVQELADYIGQSHCLEGDEALDCDASERRVKEHITHLHTRMPFDAANYLPDEDQSYAKEWLAAASQQERRI